MPAGRGQRKAAQAGTGHAEGNSAYPQAAHASSRAARDVRGAAGSMPGSRCCGTLASGTGRRIPCGTRLRRGPLRAARRRAFHRSQSLPSATGWATPRRGDRGVSAPEPGDPRPSGEPIWTPTSAPERGRIGQKPEGRGGSPAFGVSAAQPPRHHGPRTQRHAAIRNSFPGTLTSCWATT